MRKQTPTYANTQTSAHLRQYTNKHPQVNAPPTRNRCPRSTAAPAPRRQTAASRCSASTGLWRSCGPAATPTRASQRRRRSRDAQNVRNVAPPEPPALGAACPAGRARPTHLPCVGGRRAGRRWRCTRPCQGTRWLRNCWSSTGLWQSSRRAATPTHASQRRCRSRDAARLFPRSCAAAVRFRRSAPDVCTGLACECLFHRIPAACHMAAYHTPPAYAFCFACVTCEEEAGGANTSSLLASDFDLKTRLDAATYLQGAQAATPRPPPSGPAFRLFRPAVRSLRVAASSEDAACDAPACALRRVTFCYMSTCVLGLHWAGQALPRGRVCACATAELARSTVWPGDAAAAAGHWCAPARSAAQRWGHHAALSRPWSPLVPGLCARCPVLRPSRGELGRGTGARVAGSWSGHGGCTHTTVRCVPRSARAAISRPPKAEVKVPLGCHAGAPSGRAAKPRGQRLAGRAKRSELGWGEGFGPRAAKAGIGLLNCLLPTNKNPTTPKPQPQPQTVARRTLILSCSISCRTRPQPSNHHTSACDTQERQRSEQAQTHPDALLLYQLPHAVLEPPVQLQPALGAALGRRRRGGGAGGSVARACVMVPRRF